MKPACLGMSEAGWGRIRNLNPNFYRMLHFKGIINRKHAPCRVSVDDYSPSHGATFHCYLGWYWVERLYNSSLGEKLAAINSDHNRWKITRFQYSFGSSDLVFLETIKRNLFCYCYVVVRCLVLPLCSLVLSEEIYPAYLAAKKIKKVLESLHKGHILRRCPAVNLRSLLVPRVSQSLHNKILKRLRRKMVGLKKFVAHWIQQPRKNFKRKKKALKEMEWFPKINKGKSAFIEKLTASPLLFQAQPLATKKRPRLHSCCPKNRVTKGWTFNLNLKKKKVNWQKKNHKYQGSQQRSKKLCEVRRKILLKGKPRKLQGNPPVLETG